jgi:nitrous oxide reductase accessory protein NosL
MQRRGLTILCSILVVFGLLPRGAGAAQPDETGIDRNARCPVCGMFVAKFPQWLVQLKLSDGRTETFDGVKDMMAYYHSPQSYGAAAGVVVREVRVKDYYRQEWIDGRQAVYVLGGDVYGPMGHDLIAFGERSGAENFMKDHKGRRILLFTEITPQLIESLRQGHTMMGHSKNSKQ